MERSDKARREDSLYDRIGSLERVNRQQDEQIEKFKTALKKYGRHTNNCATRFIDPDIDETCNTFGKCNCEFEQILKEIN